MAEKTELKVLVTGEVLIKGIESSIASINKIGPVAIKAGKAISDIGKGPYKIAGIIPQLNTVQKNLAQTAIQAGKLDSTLGTKLATGSNSAAFALQNLGRVAQDAPFGFIGIANNINPLLESFQRLKKESGSTGGAMKALAASLIGGGGVGLAFSAVSAALSFASIGMQAWGGRNSAAKKEVDEHAESIKKQAEAYDSIIESLAKEQVKVDLIVQALKTEKLSREQRNEAIKQLQSISPAYFSTLDKENASIQSISAAYDRYTQSIIRSISAKLKEKDLTDVTEKILKLQEAGRNTGSANVVVNGKLLKVQNAQLINQDQINKGASVYQQYQKGIIGLTIQQVDELENLRLTQKQLLEDIASSQGADPFIKTDKTASASASAKTIKDIETVNDVIQKLSREIDFLNAKEIAFNTNEAAAKISAIQAVAEKLIKDFKVSPDDTIINKLFFGGKVFNPIENINIPGIEGLREKILDPLKAIFKGSPTGISIPIQPQIEIKPIDNEKFYKQLRALNIQEGIEALALDMQSVIANSFGNAITNALSGKDIGSVFGSLFKTILSTLGAGIQQLGVQTLAAGKAIVTLKKLFGTTAGIGASIGLIALGGIIKALANTIKIPGFANGVQNFSGGLAVVGERGPELVNLPRGSDVIPNHELGGSLGGGQQVFIANNIVRGSDIVQVFNRASATNSRNGF